MGISKSEQLHLIPFTRKAQKEARRQMLIDLITLKFGDQRGSRMRAAESADVASPSMYAMVKGGIPIPDRVLQALSELPDHSGYAEIRLTTHKRDSFVIEFNEPLLMLKLKDLFILLTSGPVPAQINDKTLSSLFDVVVTEYHSNHLAQIARKKDEIEALGKSGRTPDDPFA